MTEEQQRALQLRERGNTRAEIARMMGKSEKAVKGLLERARKWQNQDPTATIAANAVGGETPPHSYWLKTDNASVYYQTPKSNASVDVIGLVKDAFENIPAYEPKQVEISYNETLWLYGLYDAHIGMRSWGKETGSDDYDLKLAADDIKNGFTRLCRTTGEKGGDALLIVGGDTLHADSNDNMTPASGHILDVDGRHRLVVETAITSIAWTIEHLSTMHKRVIVRLHRGNHDPHSHLILMFALKERYRNVDRIVVDMAETDYFMFRHGNNAIFTEHGDRGSPQNFINKMADVCEFWSSCKHRVAITGHVHKFQQQRIGGCMWYSVDAFCPSDSYGSRFTGRRGLTAMAFDKEHGQTGVFYDGLWRNE